MPRGCKVCRFFDKPYRQNEKRIFEKLVREGASLRRLEVFFQALSMKIGKDTISRHIKLCMNLDVSTQRAIEKDIRREKTSKGIKRIGQRVKEFFIKPTEVIGECEHKVCKPFYDMKTEMVYARCERCGQILGYGLDPHESEKRQKKDPRNWKIYESLRRRRQ